MTKVGGSRGVSSVKPWGRVLERAVTDRTLTGSHLRLLIWFANRWRCREVDWRPFSLAFIAEATGIPRTKLPPLIADLVAGGYIDKRCGNPNEYRLTLGGCPDSHQEVTHSHPGVTADCHPEGTSECHPEVAPLFICEEEVRERKRAPPGGGAARVRATPATHTNGAPNGRSRGHRLPPDWHPSVADAQFARDCGLDPDETAEAFCDWWHAEVGPKATKLDWSRAFHTWCRRDRDKRRNGPRSRLAELQEHSRRGEEALFRAAIARS